MPKSYRVIETGDNKLRDKIHAKSQGTCSVATDDVEISPAHYLGEKGRGVLVGHMSQTRKRVRGVVRTFPQWRVTSVDRRRITEIRHYQ